MKKVLSFFLGIVTCCLITFCAFAADNTDNIPSDAEVQAYASNFMTASQKNDNIGINEFIHLLKRIFFGTGASSEIVPA